MTRNRETGHRIGWEGYASIMRGLQLNPATADEVAAAHGLHINTARTVLRALHAMQLVHVAAWRPIVQNRKAAVYGFGAFADVPHPTGKPRTFRRSNNLLPTVITLAHVMRALVRPVTIAELKAISGADHTWTGRFLRHCEQIGLARVSGWAQGHTGGHPAALWMLGSAPGAPKPQPKCRAQVHREYRARRKAARATQELHTLVAQQLHAAAVAVPFTGGAQ